MYLTVIGCAQSSLFSMMTLSVLAFEYIGEFIYYVKGREMELLVV